MKERVSKAPKNLEVKKSRNGRGVFTSKSFREGEFLLRISGKLVDPETLIKIGGKILDNAYRYGLETYLVPGKSLAAYINHSCEPNAGIRKIGNVLYVVAIKNIPRRDELTIDYSTLIGSDDIWRMKCNCGSKTCRKKIKEFSSLPLLCKQFYIKKDAVAPYIYQG